MVAGRIQAVDERDAAQDKFSELRRRAEEALVRGLENIPEMSQKEVRELVHELRTHQIELEMQNEELRRSQRELGAARDRYADLYDFAPVGYLTVGKEGLVREANLTAAAMLGVDRVKLIGQPLSGFVVREDQDAYYHHRRQVLGEIVRQHCELKMVRGDGMQFHAQLESASVPKRGGTRDEYRTALSDITRRKQVEEALRESEGRFRQMAENIREVFFLGDSRTHEILYISPAYEDIWGRPREQLRWNPAIWLEAVHPDDRKRVIGALVNLTRGQCDVEHRILRPDGSVRWVRARAFPVREREGEVGRVCGIVEDITERKQASQQAIRLERLSAVGEMSAGVSHNLNNLLTGILGPAQLLQRSVDDPEVLGAAESIQRAAERASDLVHQLHLSVRGILKEDLCPVQVNSAVQEAVEEMRPIWKAGSGTKGIAIELVTDLEDVPSVRAARSRLHDIFISLLVNAADAMPEGGTVTIRTRAIKENVQITFSDTGTGMDEETRRRAFEPFFTSKMDVGSGLGLSTAYGSMARWGGDIAVESSPGEGAVFTIWLPFWTKPDEGPPGHRRQPGPGGGNPS